MRTRFAALFLCFLISPLSFASMELNNVIFHFEPGDDARQDVEITNTGEQPLYVEIQPNLVLSPGEETEDRSVIRDPRQAGLLVTPNKLIVPAGGTKLVRMVKMGNAPTERVYRVVTKPVVGQVHGGEQSGLKIMIGYEVLAIVYPNNPKPDLSVERKGQKLFVKNNGNTNVLLREGFQCITPDMPREECTPLPGRRMYPGNEWELELPHDLPVTYYQSVGTRNYVESYP